MPPAGPAMDTSSRILIIVIIFLFLGIVAAGIVFYQSEEDRVKASVTTELTTISALKADQISAWRSERLHDGEQIAANVYFIEDVPGFVVSRTAESEMKMRNRLAGIASSGQYSDVSLVDDRSVVLISLHNRTSSLSGQTLSLMGESFRSGKTVLTDLYYSERDAKPRMDVICPLILRKGTSSETAGALVMTIDPETTLYPLVQSWPVPSESAETLLVKREGDHVLFLNELRHRQSTALNLTIPMSQTDVPAVMAVLGTTGVFEGRDYRGVDVISVLAPVPNSPWFIVTKVDSAEAYASWRSRSVLIIGLVVGSLAVLLILAGLIWQRRQKTYYQVLYASEKALNESEIKFRQFFERESSYCYLISPEGTILDLNTAALNALEYPDKSALIGKPLIRSVYSQESQEKAKMLFARWKGTGRLENEEMIIQTRTGKLRTVLLSVSAVYDAEGKILHSVSVQTDITDRKKVEDELLRKNTDLEAAFEEITATEEELRANYEEIAQTKHALEESERKYRNLYQYALVGLFETSFKDGTVVACNQRYADLAGFLSVEDAIGKDVPHLYVNPEDRQEVGRILREQGHIENRVIKLRNQRTGRIFWGQFSARFNYEQQIAEGSIIDITEQKEAEDALKKSEAKFRETLTLLDEGYYSCTLDGIVIEHNPAFNHIIGFDSGRDLKGSSLPDFWQNPEDRRAYLQELQATGFIHNYTINAKTISGSPIIVLASAHLIRDDTGKPARIDGTVTDITSLRLTETALRDVEEFNRLLINASPTYYVAIDLDGRVIMMNRAMLEVLEYTMEEVQGKDYLSTFVPAEDQENLTRVFGEITLEGRSNINVNRIISKSKKIFMVEWYGSPVKQGQGNPDFFVGVGIDITGRRKAEKDIARMNEILTQQTRTLSILNRIISTANRAENREVLFHEILDDTLELMDFDAGGIYLINHETGIATVAYSRNLPQEFLELVGTVSIHQPPYESLFLEGKPIISDHYEQISPHLAKKTGFRSVISVPLYSKDGISGSLNVISKKRYVVTEDETVTLFSIARELGNTLRKMTIEETLRESSRRLQEAQEMAHLGFWTWNVKTGDVAWSDEVFRIFGLKPQEFTPQIDSIMALSPWPEDHQRDQELIHKAMESHEPGSYEQRFLRPDKSSGYYFSTFEGRYDERGNLVTIVGTVLDITERKRAEESLRESEERFRTLVEQLPVGIAMTRREAGGESIVYYNRSFTGITGYTIETTPSVDVWVGQAYPDPEYRQKIMGLLAEMYAEASRDITSGTRSTRVTCNDGTIRDIEFRYTDLKVFGFWMLNDITERKAAEEALFESEEKYRVLFENITAAFALHEIILDTAGKPVDYRFLIVNTAFETMTGLDGAAVVNHTVREILPTTEQYWIETYGRVALTGVPELYENFSQELGRWFEVRAYSPKRGQFATVFTDITGRKQIQLQQETFIRELEQKNAELERFTFTVSHDLKSPLITIKGFAGMVEDEAGKGDLLQLKKDIRRITDAAETMQTLLSDLLELSRIGKIANLPQPVPFGAIVHEAVDLLATPLGDRGVKVEIAPQFPVVNVDHARIREVLINLIENAIKFSGDRPDPVIRIGVDTSGTTPVFFVQDNGIGINPRYLDRIFNLFERLNVTTHGTGIGLPIVRRVIEFHGGKIWAESEGEGKGTIFRFTLPGGTVSGEDKS